MRLFLQVSTFSANADGTLNIGINYAFTQSGIAYNNGVVVTITPPNPITNLLINAAIVAAAVALVNTAEGTSFTTTQVTFFGGA
jgi:hypothetical protein